MVEKTDGHQADIEVGMGQRRRRALCVVARCRASTMCRCEKKQFVDFDLIDSPSPRGFQTVDFLEQSQRWST